LEFLWEDRASAAKTNSVPVAAPVAALAALAPVAPVAPVFPVALAPVALAPVALVFPVALASVVPVALLPVVPVVLLLVVLLLVALVLVLAVLVVVIPVALVVPERWCVVMDIATMTVYETILGRPVVNGCLLTIVPASRVIHTGHRHGYHWIAIVLCLLHLLADHRMPERQPTATKGALVAEIMEAFYAGLTAWAIEITIAGIILYILHREEQKVYKRRVAKKENL
tara:strand:+ start:568 stop:1248 length:681 start_codon:yes stop_codon:yes gene_type:complete